MSNVSSSLSVGMLGLILSKMNHGLLTITWLLVALVWFVLACVQMWKEVRL
jgi:hypothetical protein